MSATALLPGEGKSVTLGPNSIGVVFKLYSEDTGGQFAMVEHALPPGMLIAKPRGILHAFWNQSASPARI